MKIWKATAIPLWERCLPAIRLNAVHFRSRCSYRGQAPLPQGRISGWEFR